MKRPKGRKSLKRRQGRRQPYDLVLIVTEGEKTEPNYIRGLRDHFELSNANIRVVYDAANDPVRLVEYCNEEQTQAKKEGEPYDALCCIFDGEIQDRVKAASDKARRSAAPIYCYISNPCFEFWLLLHFDLYRSPFRGTHTQTPCDQVIKKLLEHYPSYTKGSLQVFDDLSGNLTTAVTNSAQALDDAEKVNEWNPSTEVHKLVQYLETVAGQKY